MATKRTTSGGAGAPARKQATKAAGRGARRRTAGRASLDWEALKLDLLKMSRALGKVRTDVDAKLDALQQQLDELANTPPGTFPNVSETLQR
jgi:hypothetical protein